jgi:ubiquinone/menaquinone biosynthesis C-methylase UbiE
VKNFKEILKKTNPKLKEVIKHIPKYQPHPRLPSDWYYWQIIERHTVLKHAGVVSGANVLEVGCGPQAIATIPLAVMVGERGRVVALDRGRWGLRRSGKMDRDFWELMNSSGLRNRVIPLQEDARSLPFPYPCFDLSVCIHGIRSFENREVTVEAVKEMLRLSKERIFLAESSPIARNMAQKAHLTMYNLRQPVFAALGWTTAGDIPYFSQKELERIVKEAGAARIETQLIDVNMPHHLAWFPLETIGEIKNRKTREDLKQKWKKATRMLDEYGEEHPPVVIVNAWKEEF